MKLPVPTSALGAICALLLASPVLRAGEALSSKPAQVTFTVTQFRSAAPAGERVYVDATMQLAAHADVSLVDRAGVGALVVKRATEIEVAVDSADPAESYKAIGIYFE